MALRKALLIENDNNTAIVSTSTLTDETEDTVYKGNGKEYVMKNGHAHIVGGKLKGHPSNNGKIQ